MLRPEASAQVYLYAGTVDMRKSIDGLAALVEAELSLSPTLPALFVFCNRRRDKIKLLYWERNGFILWYKRLEQQRFQWPRPRDRSAITVTGQELNWLLDGFDIFTQKPHKTLQIDSVL